MRRLSFLAGLGLVTALLTACPIYPYEPYEPPELYDYRGDWTGTVKDSQGGEGSLGVNVTFQSATGTLGGEWTAVFGGGSASGIFNGSTNSYGNDEVSLQLIPATYTDCALSATAVRDENTLSATYNAVASTSGGCSDASFGVGTFTIGKAPAEDQ